jgi:hypothetical protein
MRLIIVLLIFVLIISGCTSGDSTGDVVEESPGCVYNGISNDPYPGQCGHYVDENSNNLCDLGES